MISSCCCCCCKNGECRNALKIFRFTGNPKNKMDQRQAIPGTKNNTKKSEGLRHFFLAKTKAAVTMQVEPISMAVISF